MQKKLKDVTFHNTDKSFFYDSKNFALPRFPTIYQIHLPKSYKYTKQYDVMYEIYYEQDRLLSRDDIFLYNYLQSLANRGLILRIKEFAAFVEMDPDKFIRHLDRLENALLIHRVNRQDLQGKPNDLIVHLPASHEQWTDGLRDKVIKRIEVDAVRLTRKETGIEKENADGKKRLYIPRNNGKFHFNYKNTFKTTFSKEADAEGFAKSILRYFNDAKNEIAKDVKAFDDSLRQMVKDSFQSRNQTPEEKHYRAALTMRKIYAPVIGEF